MTEIIGVRFRESAKNYYFGANGLKAQVGQKVIVETARGLECAQVSIANRMVEEEEIVQPLKNIIRIATDEDIIKQKENEKKEQKAFEICEKKILEHELDMKLTRVEYSFDNSKIIFFFTADGRVDFRELVKDLASEFKSRIELRQIGVRDEAKMLGGIGICGQSFCCSRFLDEFQPVSIKMAKEQNLSPNPLKISGSCGRLMCCLKYEHDTYEALRAELPSVGSTVNTIHGIGTVSDVNVLTGALKVKLQSDEEGAPVSVHFTDIIKPQTEHKNKRRFFKDRKNKNN
ncbi:MAG: stage 0 sporulation family protein [Clostridia bacterium]|nr:stage 0 sporulation family protein [Clostridia bacterium]